MIVRKSNDMNNNNSNNMNNNKKINHRSISAPERVQKTTSSSSLIRSTSLKALDSPDHQAAVQELYDIMNNAKNNHHLNVTTRGIIIIIINIIFVIIILLYHNY